MFCGNCGQQLKDDAKFCHGCGAAVGAAETPVQNGNTTDVITGVGAGNGVGNGAGGGNRVRRTRKKKKNLIWIPIAAAALVLVVLVGILVGSLLGSDSAKLVKAITKSANAYTEAAEKMGVPDLSYIAKDKAYSADVAVKIYEVDGDNSMAGIGARMEMDVSLPKREIGVSATPFFGSADLMTASMKMDNEKIYVGSPELTGDTFYMINTESLGADLNNLGAGVPELEEFGFNLFDIVEQIEKISAQNEKAGEELKKAFAEFVKAIEVDKTGTEEVEINGNDLKCTVYEVVITEDAMADLVDAFEDIYKDMDNVEDYLVIFESMGLPEEAIAEMQYELEYEMEYAAEDVEEMFDGLREAVDMLRDVELEVYVNDGYVVGAVYDQRIDGTRVEITLNLGGGENYVDDLSLRINADGGELTISSNGNHTGEGGEFTDAFMMAFAEYDYEYPVLYTYLRYEPKAKADNFQLDINTSDVSMLLRGQVTTTSDSISMSLDEVSVFEYDYNLMYIGLDCNIGKYQASSIKTRNAIELGKMNEEQLMHEMEKIEENAMEWAEKLMAEVPELMYIF